MSSSSDANATQTESAHSSTREDSHLSRSDSEEHVSFHPDPDDTVPDEVFVDGGNPSEVVRDFLWVGSVKCAASKKTISRLGLTHVLNMAEECVGKYRHYDGVTYRDLPTEDVPEAQIGELFKEAIQFISEAKEASSNNKVLVHCFMGVSRSATVCMAYMIQNLNYTFWEAYSSIKATRPYVTPNEGFFEVLRQYERARHGQESLRRDPYLEFTNMIADKNWVPPPARVGTKSSSKSSGKKSGSGSGSGSKSSSSSKAKKNKKKKGFLKKMKEKRGAKKAAKGKQKKGSKDKKGKASKASKGKAKKGKAKSKSK